MPICEALMLCFRRVDITQRAAARVVSVLCHIRKLGPRGGFGQNPFRENKTVVLRVIIYDRTCLEHLTPPVVARLAVTSRNSNNGIRARGSVSCLVVEIHGHTLLTRAVTLLSE